MEVLEKSKVPLSSKEIARQLNIDEFKVVKILNKLAMYDEVLFFTLPKDLAMKFYKCKRRMRLFYV